MKRSATRSWSRVLGIGLTLMSLPAISQLEDQHG